MADEARFIDFFCYWGLFILIVFNYDLIDILYLLGRAARAGFDDRIAYRNGCRPLSAGYIVLHLACENANKIGNFGGDVMVVIVIPPGMCWAGLISEPHYPYRHGINSLF